MMHFDIPTAPRVCDNTAHQLFARLQRDFDLYRSNESRADWFKRAEMLLEWPADDHLDRSDIAQGLTAELMHLLGAEDDRSWWNGDRYAPWGGSFRFEDYAMEAGRILAAVVEVIGSDVLDVEPAISACAEALLDHARDTGDPARGRELIRLSQAAITDHIFL